MANVVTDFQPSSRRYYNMWLADHLKKWDSFDRWDGTNELNMANVAHYHPPFKNEFDGKQTTDEYWDRIRDLLEIYKSRFGNVEDGVKVFDPQPDSVMTPLYHKRMDEKADFAKAQRLGLTVPFSHNTGPGNSPKEPSNTADEHSLTHDLAYSKGGDVWDDDNEFIQAMFDHAVDDPVGSVSQLTGLVGGIGIKAKQAIESKTGQLYPAGNVESS